MANKSDSCLDCPADKFDYFMERTEKDLDHIKAKLDDLWGFKMRLMGASIVISLASSVFSYFFYLYLKH